MDQDEVTSVAANVGEANSAMHKKDSSHADSLNQSAHEADVPILFRSPRIFLWITTPGSTLQLAAGILAVVVLTQLVLGKITLSEGLVDVGSVAFLGVALPKRFARFSLYPPML